MPRNTDFSLAAVPDLPAPTNPSTQTAWLYVFEALIDRPGQTWVSLAANRPQHLTAGTIENTCYRLVTRGVIVQEGHGRTALFRPAANALEKVSDTWEHEGRGPGHRDEREGGAHTKGPGAVAQLPAEQRAPLPPPKGKPAELADNIVKTPSGKFLVVKDPPPAAPRPAVSSGAIQAAEAKYTEACIVLIVADKPRSYPISVAKSLYKQLREIFD